MELDDWSEVPIPRLAFKINTAILDQYYYQYQMKNRGANKKPGELELCATSLVMLKAASVLGEEFDLKALQTINPFPKQAKSGKIVMDCIRMLE